MPRKKPQSRIVAQRSRNNANRRLSATLPSLELRQALVARVQYGAYSKHKYNPSAYKLSPYAGMDVERTYCDAHAGFGKEDFSRITGLLFRGIMLGLWSDQSNQSPPTLLWTVDESGWIFELRITNAEQALYHGYPLLPQDAFARHVLVRARSVAFSDSAFSSESDQGVQAAIAAAEIFYR